MSVIEHLPRDHGANRKCSSRDFTNERTAHGEGTHRRHLRDWGVGNLMEPFGTVPAEGFDPTFKVNVRGTLFIVQKALALFCDHASMISNGEARSGGRGFSTVTVCAAIQEALRLFPRTCTSALQDRKIRVNALNPGRIATPARDFLPPGAQKIYAEGGFLRKPGW